MKKITIPLIIIIFNILIVVLTSFSLYDDYKRAGKFQWVDQNAIEDHEELFLTPIFFSLAILGMASIIYETLKLKGIIIQNVFVKTLDFLLKTLSYIYGTFLLFVSFIFVIMTLGNIGNHDYEKGFVFSVSILLMTLLSIGLLGGLIIYNNIRNKNSS